MNREVSAMEPSDMLAWAAEGFGGGAVVASSLGAEDQVLTHMIGQRRLPLRVFTLDTGRLFPESYDLIERTREELGVSIEVFFPDPSAVESMVREEGVNLFYRSVELRKRCCGIRKVEPLRRALSGASVWIVGLRNDQSPTRSRVETLEWDDANGLLKLSPLARWSADDVWAYVRAHGVPYHPLHDRGFPSIGCAPCTRAVDPGEDPRAGRWWWERPDQKECGLHQPAEAATPRVSVDRFAT